RRGTTARQLSEARLMLESEAAAFAAEHADANDLAALERALERLDASRTPLDRVRNDLAFHTTLVAASHNPVIETMFATIQVRASRTSSEACSETSPRWLMPTSDLRVSPCRCGPARPPS